MHKKIGSFFLPHGAVYTCASVHQAA